MPYGMAVRGIFGDEVVSKFASVAAANTNHHLASSDFLGAAFSAAHFVRLTGRQSWADDDQERMSGELKQSVTSQQQANDSAGAASRAASYQMLTGEIPWTESETEEMRSALKILPGERHVFSSVSVAERLAHYLLIGGPIFWTEDEFHEMRKAVITDFEACVQRGDEALAADRLAIFDVIEGNLEASHTMS
jgi:hypothetical protein